MAAAQQARPTPRRPRPRTRPSRAAFKPARNASQRGQDRRSDREVQRGHREGPELRRVLHQHRRDPPQGEGVRPGRGRLQEGDRANADSAEAYNGLANVYNAQRSSIWRRKRARRRRSCSAPRARRAPPAAARAPAPSSTRASSPGTPARFPRRRSTSSGGQHRSEAGRSALLARHGQRQPGQAARSGEVFEDYLKLDATGQYAEQAKGDPRVDQEIGVQEVQGFRRFRGFRVLSIAENLAAVRGRIAAAARRAGRDPADVMLVAVSKTFRGRSRARGLRRRPARFRREQSPGGPAEDRRNGRYRGQVAPDRPPAVEQGQEGGGGVSLHPLGGLGRPAAAPRRGAASGRPARHRSRFSSRSTSPAKRRSSAPRPTRPSRSSARRCSAGRSRLKGLMLLPPWSEDAEQTRPWFARLRELRERLVAGRHAGGSAARSCRWA